MENVFGKWHLLTKEFTYQNFPQAPSFYYIPRVTKLAHMWLFVV